MNIQLIFMYMLHNLSSLPLAIPCKLYLENVEDAKKDSKFCYWYMILYIKADTTCHVEVTIS